MRDHESLVRDHESLRSDHDLLVCDHESLVRDQHFSEREIMSCLGKTRISKSQVHFRECFTLKPKMVLCIIFNFAANDPTVHNSSTNSSC